MPRASIFPPVAFPKQNRKIPDVNQNHLFRPLLVIGALAFQFLVLSCRGAGYPDLANGDWICPQFKFASGEQLENLRIHYRTTGRPEKNSRGVVTNVVLVLHGTTGSGAQFVRPEFAGQLFGPGQLLDSNRFYVVLPDGIGHGQSSRPSEQLHDKFPKYGYLDMVEAQRRLLTEGLGVNHLRLVMGTSMGGMHTWLWGEIHPEFMDALLPLASLPTQISGRNRVWRRMIIDSIRNDPGWQDGEYSAQPRGLRTALEVLYFMGSNPLQRYKEAPTLKQADELLDAYVAGQLKTADANNILYAVQASHDYEPNTNLEKIKAPLVAINFADDLINPPELGILEKEIQRVPNGKAIVVPMTDQTRGHGTHTLAAVWKRHLADLLNAGKLPPE
jgi:homoserine O-acetyltransferase/O-succinyltransferase